MGYTPEDQLLNPSLSKILEGMDEFDAAFKKRVEANEISNEWKQEHLEELGNKNIKLI